MKLPQLRRIRWAVRGVLVLGVAASTVANTLAADPNGVSRTIAAWPPLALLLTIELISRIPVHRRALAGARLCATAVIAGIAAWVSYWHMAEVAARYGETGASPYLLPLSVDGLIVVASICLVELAGRILAAQQPSSPAEVPASTPEPAAEPPAAPEPAPETPEDGSPEPDETAGEGVRQDDRSAQEIEVVVRAVKAANPGMGYRKIAAAAATSPNKVRRILGRELTLDLAPSEPDGQANGRVPELSGARRP
ncbi:MAG TPA: DUF2637 domain-containing protein [Catenuloplanes sp.]